MQLNVFKYIIIFLSYSEIFIYLNSSSNKKIEESFFFFSCLKNSIAMKLDKLVYSDYLKHR